MFHSNCSRKVEQSICGSWDRRAGTDSDLVFGEGGGKEAKPELNRFGRKTFAGTKSIRRAPMITMIGERSPGCTPSQNLGTFTKAQTGKRRMKKPRCLQFGGNFDEMACKFGDAFTSAFSAQAGILDAA